MYILLTNDDGYQSAGLAALRAVLSEIGEVAVVAPDRNWSAAGHYRKLFDPMRAWQGELSDGSPALICDGTPADCVALAVMGLLDRKPDLVVSGINLGANLGTDLLYSGTVAAAMEGLVFGIPGLAVSQAGKLPDVWDFGAAQWAVRQVVTTMTERTFPADVLLNLNIPAVEASALRGIQAARLGKRAYRDELVVRQDPRGRPYYWIGGSEPQDLHQDGTDVTTVAAGYASLTAVHMDLTSQSGMDLIHNWQFEAVRA